MVFIRVLWMRVALAFEELSKMFYLRDAHLDLLHLCDAYRSPSLTLRV